MQVNRAPHAVQGLNFQFPVIELILSIIETSFLFQNSAMSSDHDHGDAGDKSSASVNPSPSSLPPASGSSSVTSVSNVPPVLDPRLGRLEITTENVVRPRSECQGGHGQLKLGNKTRTPLTEEERKARAIARVKSKVGEEVANKILKKWEETKNKTD